MADHSDKPDKSNKGEKKKELSPEDIALKENLDLLAVRISDPNVAIQKEALVTFMVQLAKTIRESTCSMTSVPKPLKFLRPHYENIKNIYYSLSSDNSENKRALADILSVLSITMATPNSRQSLYFKLYGNLALKEWGYEYIKNLSSELIEEWSFRVDSNASIEDLLELVKLIVPISLEHNAEAEAIDLLLEIDLLEMLPDFLCNRPPERVLQYLLSYSGYATDREELLKLTSVIYTISMAKSHYTTAFVAALKANDTNMIIQILSIVSDKLLLTQLLLILYQSRMAIPELESSLKELVSWDLVSDLFKALAKDLDVIPPKKPEDIYKSHLADSENKMSSGAHTIDSSKQNLANCFVNAFVNCGFGNDSLMLPEDSRYVFKVKDHQMLSATGCLGLLLLWDVDTGYSTIDRYSLTQITHIKAGALLATGILGTGVTSEIDAAMALLSDHLSDNDKPFNKLMALLGFGFSYCSTNREDVMNMLIPLLTDPMQPLEITAFAALTLSLVFLGSSNDLICGSIIQILLESSEDKLNDPLSKYFALSLGLLFLGSADMSEAVMETLGVVSHPIGKLARIVTECCSYCCSGNVLLVQKLLALLSETISANDKSLEDQQAAAVLGIASVVVGESVGTQMSFRIFDDLLQYSEQNIRRVVPLALGLISVSDPQVGVIDSLSKLSHDPDELVSMNAIFSLGLVGAGTNHARIASLLRGLASYYAKESNHLFLVKIAQGLGLMTLSPLWSDRMLYLKPSIAGLLTVMFSMNDIKNTILSYRHYLLLYLTLAIRPRWLMTIDEHLKPISVQVRVGQAVDTVAMAGTRKTITGFQTLSTPVLFGAGDRAELATDEYIALSPILEGIVIVKKI